MEERYGHPWSREETILAFDLYCKIPFSKISRRNKQIIELADLLGRTPSSVALKMTNLASYDQKLKIRGIKGMKNTSKLDGQVWEEFLNNWENLAYEAQLILYKRKQIQLYKKTSFLESDNLLLGQYQEQLSKVRIGQSFFRISVLNAYNKRCCITGLDQVELLIASHIKPWKDCDIKTERTNPSNGLCLNAFHDKVFDRGLITIDQNYKIIISKKLKLASMDENTKDWIKGYENKEIMLPDKFIPDKDFIQYHNDMIFQR